jgi:hypothetical protein
LTVADGLAEPGGEFAGGGINGAHHQKGDFEVEVDKAFDDYSFGSTPGLGGFPGQ